MEQFKPLTDAEARASTVCVGCGGTKDIGLVVCWNCYSHRKDVTPLKWFQGFDGDFQDWQQMVNNQAGKITSEKEGENRG